MKLHRVLLFTTIQMDITPVGDDLHILLTGGDNNRIGATVFSHPIMDSETPHCESSVISNVEEPDSLFCKYVAEKLALETGQNVQCTGGVFVENPDEHETKKLYENLDDIIKDWTTFFTA